jgi:anti-sigma factor RsiW
MTNSNMTCEAFDAALPDYLEGTLAEPLRAAVNKHLCECVRCTSLVRDLQKIQKEAAALPDLVPSRDLWQGIEARIAAPVIPFATRPELQKRHVPAWMGIAAAALIVSTAGITYMLTARSLKPDSSRTAAQVATRTSGADTQQGIDSGASQNPQAMPADVGGTSSGRAPSAGSSVRGTGIPVDQPVSGARMASQTGPEQRPEAVYSKEIEMLQNIVTQRRAQLDSSTIAIIERNLRIIDAAIASSRDALEKDPASRLLGEQLTHALDKKVELLRTAALLPAST